MSHRPGRLSRAWLPLALAGAVAVAGAPLGHRVGLVPLVPAFLALLAGVLLSFVVLPVALTIVARDRRALADRRPIIAAALIAAVTAGGPVLVVVSALRLPAIHDITTDLADPPRFEAVVALRADVPNPLEYGGPAVAEAQREAYPDLETLALSHTLDQVVDWALEVTQQVGWEIVAVDRAAGRIEATDTTLWFGFKDDIVVRVRPATGGARVDVRSVSRVGVGDLGANAARIRVFLARLSDRAGE